MNPPLLNWFTRSDGLPELVHDLRTGKAGFTLRVALSVAAACAVFAFMLGAVGMVAAMNGRITDELAFVSTALAAAAWCGALAWLWSGYRHWRRTLRTTFGLMAMWSVIILITIAIETVARNGEYLIGSCIVLGLAITVAVIATVAYRSHGGRKLRDEVGGIHVRCPACSYSMVGLETCQCPECGHRSTIDSLIAAQDYEAHRSPRAVLDSIDASPQTPPAALLGVQTGVKALPHGSA